MEEIELLVDKDAEARSDSMGKLDIERMQSAPKPPTAAVSLPNVDFSSGSAEASEVKRALLDLHMALIFDAWDVDDSATLSLWEIQVGFYRAGAYFSSERLLSALGHRCGHQLSVEGFRKLLRGVCRNDSALEEVLAKIAGQVPAAKIAVEGAGTSNISALQSFENSVLRRSKTSRKRAGAFATRRCCTPPACCARVLRLAYKRLVRPVWRALTFQSGRPLAGAAIGCWIMAFSLWYHLFLHFEGGKSFYYSVQAGLSVGFGALTEEYRGGVVKRQPGDCIVNEEDELSAGAVAATKLVTIANVLLGSGIVGGALSYLIESAVSEADVWYSAAEANEKRLRLTRGSGEYYAFNVGRVWMDYRGEVQVGLAVVLFLVAGVIFGVARQGWPFSTALYFAVTSMSTGGLQAINDPDDVFSTVFVGFYVLLSVPVYALALGSFAQILVKGRMEREAKRKLRSSITLAEFEAVQRAIPHSHCKYQEDDQGSIELIEFLEMELLRSGKCDLDFLKQVHSRFEECDITSSGTITLLESLCLAVFDRFDTDESGLFDYEEFRRCVGELQQVEALGLKDSYTEDELQSMFDDADREFAADDLLDQREFLKFLQKTCNVLLLPEPRHYSSEGLPQSDSADDTDVINGG